MVSLKEILFLSCIALTVASPRFFHIRPTQEPAEQRQDTEQPLKDGSFPLNQVRPQLASPSYDYGGGGAGGDTDATASNSAEDDADGGSLGGDTDNDGADNEAGENEAAEAGENAAENNSPDAVAVGGISGAGAAPNSLGGGPGHLAKGGEKSSAGRNAGIAVGVIAMVGLAAGIAYFVYRKRKVAAYGARF